MNILIITQHWYPDSFGGSEHVASEQARRLAARGHAVTVLTERVRDVLPVDEMVHNPSQPSLNLGEGDRSVPPLRLRGGEGELRIIRYGSEADFARFGGASRTDMREVPRILRHLDRAQRVERSHAAQGVRSLDSARDDKPLWDVAILHHPYSAYGFVKAKLKIPSLYIFHTSTSREAEIEGIRRKLPFAAEPFRPLLNSLFIAKTAQIERRVLSVMGRIAVLSDFSQLILHAAFPFTERKTLKLPVGIDRVQFSPSSDRKSARAHLGLPADRKMILTVRRFTPRMGLFELISAMQTVIKEYADAQLYIVGEGPLKNELQHAIQDKGLQSKVTIVGAVPVDDLPLYYQAANLFVLPTAAFEGLGMATLEALASGLPVVGTPAGATLEVLCALDPTLITNGITAADIAHGIIQFFARPENERTILGTRAREVAEQMYDWDRAVGELEGVLQNLIGRI